MLERKFVIPTETQKAEVDKFYWNKVYTRIFRFLKAVQDYCL
ncbi:hypothetical protein KP509_13G076100 [Ceratopteris richardii]|uniref:Uncharacterized protein n=1 Tax=Ceratopteris richardii TaxID=49495 RepID=A0A8T2TK33_CERRI|nr:hypothetical protein KP509_13G076100 [Ceratopteris richardii]